MTLLPALLAALLLLPVAGWADDAPTLPAVVGDALYKGVVGKALDAVPMDAEQRVALQRTNAVVSNMLTARSLSVWVIGLTNPLLLIGGLAWGLFAASNIKAQEAKRPPVTAVLEPKHPPVTAVLEPKHPPVTTVLEPVVPVETVQETGDEPLAAGS